MLLRCLKSLGFALIFSSLSAPSVAESLTQASFQQSWSDTIVEVVDSVVLLEIAHLRSFANEKQGVSTATGFVVDSERGYIVTNRHVLGLGPVDGVAYFQNKERLSVKAVYRDPLHDFSILQYDPKQLSNFSPKGLKLDQNKARRGLDIRVIGSDGGEQLSILAGTIARLDRAAPRYGRYGYNDFNTFYFQAASGTSGGSSGSPVVDIEGDVVALNAGANSNTASSFFLPLNGVIRALAYLRNDQKVPRGTVQTIFQHLSIDRLKRLGLPEQYIRAINEVDQPISGLLTVGQVFREGMASDKLLVGDILLTINDEPVYDFYTLSEILDGAVGQKIGFTVWRGDHQVSVAVNVADLHQLQPDRLLEFGGGVLHDISYQQARAMFLPQRGVVVTDSGYLLRQAGMAEQVVITEINEQPINNVDDFLAVLAKARDADQWLVRFTAPGREYTSELARLEVDDQWYESRLCRREGADAWTCDNLQLAGKSTVNQKLSDLKPIDYDDDLLNRLAPNLVWVEFDIPHPVDNVYARHFRGAGILVDPEEGLIAVDRNTVPVALGDARVTFFGTESLFGRVVFTHPLQNVALIKVDPALLKSYPFPKINLDKGLGISRDVTKIVGFSSEGSLFSQSIGNYTEATLNFNPPRSPYFQTLPVDVYAAPNMPPSAGGILVNDDGLVHALWVSFSFEERGEVAEGFWGLPANIVREALEAYKNGSRAYDQGIIADYITISEAKNLGLPFEWQKKLVDVAGIKRQALYVQQVYSPAAKQTFRVGDVLLAIDDRPLTTLREMQVALQTKQAKVTVLRSGRVEVIELSVDVLDGRGTHRLLFWGGAYLQVPHVEVARRLKFPIKGIFVSDTQLGSPAARDGLYPNRFITAVDGREINTIEDFLAAVNNRDEGDVVRLSLKLLSGQETLIGLKISRQFWPTFELRRGINGWVRKTYE